MARGPPGTLGLVPARNADLHGNVPENARAALLLVDVINDMEFEGGEKLIRHALPMARRLARLKARARAVGIPAVYVNDNFGRWRSDFRVVVEHCLTSGVRGEEVARLLRPHDDDYFVLKPKHSGFYATTLLGIAPPRVERCAETRTVLTTDFR